jgi:hypothetical protein
MHTRKKDINKVEKREISGYIGRNEDKKERLTKEPTNTQKKERKEHRKANLNSRRFVAQCCLSYSCLASL